MACKWGGGKMDDATLHVLVQRMGALAEAQTQARLPQPPAERQPQRPASTLAVLMVDGWQVRQRGPGWGETADGQAARGISRTQDGRVLFARAISADPGRARTVDRQSGRELAGRAR